MVQRHHRPNRPRRPHAPPPPPPAREPREATEIVQGLRAGLAVFAKRKDDVLRVAYARESRAGGRGAPPRRDGPGVSPCREAAPPVSSIGWPGRGTTRGSSWRRAPAAGSRAPTSCRSLLVRTRGTALALDRVRNPYNVGAVLRTAAFLRRRARAARRRRALTPASLLHRRSRRRGRRGASPARADDGSRRHARAPARAGRTRRRCRRSGTHGGGRVRVRPPRRAGRQQRARGPRRTGVRAQCDAVVAIRGGGAVGVPQRRRRGERPRGRDDAALRRFDGTRSSRLRPAHRALAHRSPSPRLRPLCSRSPPAPAPRRPRLRGRRHRSPRRHRRPPATVATQAVPPPPTGAGELLRPPAEEHRRRAARALAASRVREPDARRHPARHLGGLPLDGARRGALPPPRRRARRAAESQPARHAGRVRHHGVRDRLRPHAGARRRAAPRRAPERDVRRPSGVDGGRQALRLHEHDGRRRGALARRRDQRRGAPRPGRASEPDPRLDRAVDGGPEEAPREARSRGPGCSAARAGRTTWPEHPGDRRRQGPEQHVRDARHPHEPARRGPLRLLRRVAARARRRAGGDHHAHRQGRRVRRRHARAGRATRPRDDDPQAVLVRHDLRSLPPRGGHPRRSHRRGRAPRGIVAARRSRPHPRRPHGAAGLRVAPERAEHAPLGRGSRRRRLEREGPGARQGHDHPVPVLGAARGARADRAAVRRLRLGRQAGHRAARRARREPALDAHLRRERRRAAPQAARALGPLDRRALQAPGLAGVPAATERRVGRPAGGPVDLPLGRRLLPGGRSAVPRPHRSRHGQDRAPLSQREDGVRALPHVHGARHEDLPHVAPVADGSAERVPPHARRSRRGGPGRGAGVRVHAAAHHAHP